MNTQHVFATAFRSRFAMRRSFTAPDSGDAKFSHSAISRSAGRAMKLILPGCSSLPYLPLARITRRNILKWTRAR